MQLQVMIKMVEKQLIILVKDSKQSGQMELKMTLRIYKHSKIVGRVLIHSNNVTPSLDIVRFVFLLHLEIPIQQYSSNKLFKTLAVNYRQVITYLLLHSLINQVTLRLLDKDLVHFNWTLIGMMIQTMQELRYQQSKLEDKLLHRVVRKEVNQKIYQSLQDKLLT